MRNKDYVIYEMDWFLFSDFFYFVLKLANNFYNCEGMAPLVLVVIVFILF